MAVRNDNTEQEQGRSFNCHKCTWIKIYTGFSCHKAILAVIATYQYGGHWPDFFSTWQRLYDFKNYQAEISQSTANGTASEISRYVSDLERQLRGFTRGHSRLLSKLAAKPASSDYKLELEALLENEFPTILNYSIASKTGWSIVQRGDIEIGDLCKQDIRNYAVNRKNILKET